MNVTETNYEEMADQILEKVTKERQVLSEAKHLIPFLFENAFEKVKMQSHEYVSFKTAYECLEDTKAKVTFIFDVLCEYILCGEFKEINKEQFLEFKKKAGLIES